MSAAGRRPWRAAALAALAAVTAGGATAWAVGGSWAGFDAQHWRAVFRRPAEVPSPAANPLTAAKVALGARLFEDVRLSGGAVACSSCHQAALSFSDGVPLRTGLDGEPLERRTPALWNLAWGASLFWDGRADSLEAQASGPIGNAREMAGNVERAAATLGQDPAMRQAFAAAFPEDPAVRPDTIAKALAAFERSLVSPETRFDRWVAGDDAALDPDELAGFRLFVGKAGCVSCHTGWRFTDEAFHDIGLPTADRGRGAVLGMPRLDHAFKTPSLRERLWTAPYMHDGSLATLEEVVDHYADRVIERPSLSSDLRRRLALSAQERAQLVAFLATLSSEDPPRPLAMPPRTIEVGLAAAAVPAAVVGQRDRRFTPAAVVLAAGEALTIVNDDTRTHAVRVDGPGLGFSAEAQEPGDRVRIAFERPGRFEAICGIHPDMKLGIVVTP